MIFPEYALIQHSLFIGNQTDSKIENYAHSAMFSDFHHINYLLTQLLQRKMCPFFCQHCKFRLNPTPAHS